MLLTQLLSPITSELIWMPPGGGVKLNEKLEETVQREFLEETGLKISVQKLFHINEVIENGFHAVEFFYLVEYVSGVLDLGSDPELDHDEQILKKLDFKEKKELNEINLSPHYLKEQVWFDYASFLKS